MKRLLILVCLLGIVSTAATAQKLVIGDRAAEIKAKEWIDGAPKVNNLPRFIEFFHSSSASSVERITPLNEMAKKYSGKLSVIVVCRESIERISEVVGTKNSFSVAIDEGTRTFTAYDVSYVPFGVLVDAKGRILWFGNPASLTDSDIQKCIK